MKMFCTRVLAVASAHLCVALTGQIAFAAEKKDARITQVVREVRVLASRSASRAASVNDVVGEGTAVRTGGGIAMAEFHHKSWTKFIVIEGKGVLLIKSNGQELTLLPGEIVTLPPGAKTFTKPQAIDLRKLTQKSLLIRSSKLPGWAQSLIESQVEKQQTSHPGGLTDPTGFDAIDQRAATDKPPKPVVRPPG